MVAGRSSPGDHAAELAFAAQAATVPAAYLPAERLAGRALRAAESLPAGRKRDRAFATALRALGTAQRARGQYGTAQGTFARALACANSGFGEASLEAAELHNDLGMTFKYVGRFPEAEAAYEAARAILEALPDADPEDVAALLHNLGGLAYARGAYERAEPLARQAVEIRSDALGAAAPTSLLDRSAHAAILARLGRSAEAEASIRALLPALEAGFGPDHPEVAVALNNLAALAQERGALDEAESLYRRVIEIRVARLGAGSPAMAVPINNLGTLLRERGRLDEAAELYRRALALLADAVDDDHPDLAAIRRNLVRIEGPPARGSPEPSSR